MDRGVRFRCGTEEALATRPTFFFIERGVCAPLPLVITDSLISSMYNHSDLDRIKRNYLTESFPKVGETSHQDVRRVVDLIRQELFSPDLTVASLLDRLSIRSREVSGIFRHEYGVGIKHFINEHRLCTARRILSCTDATCLAVALMVGFSSESAFCKAMKRHFGDVPSAVCCAGH